MKKTVALLLVMVLLFIMAGCNNEKRQSASEIESLAGYMVIEDKTLHLDEIEVITLEDEERMAELGLTQQNDMPNGYYFYNLDTEKKQYELTDETVYTFVDYNLIFVKDEDGDRLYTTTKKEEFIQHLNTSYSDSPPAQKVPFFIEVKDGKVISVTEKFEYTI